MKYKFFKKASVFGMDARITITIMSIIALISYFNIKDVIQKSTDETVIKQVDALRTSARQHIVDNGMDFYIGGSLNNNIFGINTDPAGITPSRNRNSYITEPDFASSAGEGVISTPVGKITVDLLNVFASNAEDGTSYSTTDCANTSSSCHYWFELTNVPKEYYIILEENYDGDSADANAVDTGIVVAPGQTLAAFTGTVLIKIGER